MPVVAAAVDVVAAVVAQLEMTVAADVAAVAAQLEMTVAVVALELMVAVL